MSYFVIDFYGYDADLDDWIADSLEYGTIEEAHAFMDEITRDGGASLQFVSLDELDGELFTPPEGVGYGG